MTSLSPYLTAFLSRPWPDMLLIVLAAWGVVAFGGYIFAAVRTQWRETCAQRAFLRQVEGLLKQREEEHREHAPM